MLALPIAVAVAMRLLPDDDLDGDVDLGDFKEYFDIDDDGQFSALELGSAISATGVLTTLTFVFSNLLLVYLYAHIREARRCIAEEKSRASAEEEMAAETKRDLLLERQKVARLSAKIISLETEIFDLKNDRINIERKKSSENEELKRTITTKNSVTKWREKVLKSRARDADAARVAANALADELAAAEKALQSVQVRREAEKKALLNYDGNQYLIDAACIEFDSKRMHLGEGAFGKVFRSKVCGMFGSTVAVKILHEGMGKEYMHDFANEIKLLAFLKHDNIVAFRGTTRIDGCEGLVTELCSGGSLAIALYGPLDNSKSRNCLISYRELPRLRTMDRLLVAEHVAAAMLYLHAHNFLHRDLKPDNVLLKCGIHDGQFECAKVADYGTSKGVTDAISASIGEVGAKGPVGSPMYMAPEVIGNTILTGSAGKNSDIYSFAVLLNELVAADPEDKIWPSRTRPWECVELGFPSTSRDEIWDKIKGGVRPNVNRVAKEITDYRAGLYTCLIKACWAHEAITRPDFKIVMARLQEAKDCDIIVVGTRVTLADDVKPTSIKAKALRGHFAVVVEVTDDRVPYVLQIEGSDEPLPGKYKRELLKVIN